MSKKTGIILITCLAIIALCFVINHSNRQATQTIYRQIATENAWDLSASISDSTSFKIEDMVFEAGKSYQVTIGYEIIEKSGKGIFSENSSIPYDPDVILKNPAIVGCTQMELKTVFKADTGSIKYKIDLTVNPSDITGKNGHPFNPKTQKICPVIIDITGVGNMENE